MILSHIQEYTESSTLRLLALDVDQRGNTEDGRRYELWWEFTPAIVLAIPEGLPPLYAYEGATLSVA